jgi:hypothetical protein
MTYIFIILQNVWSISLEKMDVGEGGNGSREEVREGEGGRWEEWRDRRIGRDILGLDRSKNEERREEGEKGRLRNSKGMD